MWKGSVFKRGLALGVAGVIALSLAACGQSTPGSNGTGNKGQIELKFSHIWGSDTDPFTASAKKVIEDYQKENQNVKIIVDTNENEAYKTKIKAMAAADELPDLFSTWGAGFSKPFIDANRVLAIDEYLTEDVKSKIVNGGLVNVQYGGKTYGLPFLLSVGGLFVNEEMFESNNIKIPSTYDELLTAIKEFKAKGITPMAVSGKDKWTIAMYFDVMALRAAGSEKITKTLSKQGSFKDAEFLNAAQRFKELIDAGAFSTGASGISNDEAEVPFFEGKIPMMFKGSWTAGKAEGESSKVSGKIIPIAFPELPGGAGNIKEYTGGAVDAVMVSANTKNKEEAVKFQMYFAENMARESYQAGASMPAWKVEVDESKINKCLVDVVKLTSDAESYTIWWDTMLEGKDTETYLNALQELFIGTATPQQFVDKLQTIYK
ncbi:carbohydrate ABC transporter substrate-binding protein (CUT1 family) [Anaerobacterium chartisolvens]|uniref:Carbohydrate ABC transporter substrate-binding protein (CUT1 family) n=1 Tax=Anaerobacterium chartisolvens TaxID=1297424 RepID=A0A369B7M1_9FIRM|nr:extracellular solute-binding protein [Anaerobacterium chartisolvens]RCX16598.1 carbohydrate ABC transporter substrate-binding protein (CUT1 family) [Anaerobacterium chartisolvens]